MSTFYTDIKRDGWRLVDAEGRQVMRGQVLKSHRGEEWTIMGGMPPQHAGSSGRVYAQPTTDGEGRRREFFPNVFECKWVQG